MTIAENRDDNDFERRLARTIEQVVAVECKLRSHALLFLVDGVELRGEEPQHVDVWATLHFFRAGSPFCCNNPACHLALASPERLACICEEVRRQMDLPRLLSLNFKRVTPELHGNVEFLRAV